MLLRRAVDAAERLPEIPTNVFAVTVEEEPTPARSPHQLAPLVFSAADPLERSIEPHQNAFIATHPGNVGAASAVTPDVLSIDGNGS